MKDGADVFHLMLVHDVYGLMSSFRLEFVCMCMFFESSLYSVSCCMYGSGLSVRLRLFLMWLDVLHSQCCLLSLVYSAVAILVRLVFAAWLMGAELIAANVADLIGSGTGLGPLAWLGHIGE